MDTAKIISAISVKPDWLIVDHYILDEWWEGALIPCAHRIFFIDDYADRVHDCDLLLDQNLVAEIKTRYDDKIPPSCGKMLGSEYALLQPIYAELHDRIPSREGLVRRILIFFGGMDRNNLFHMVIERLLHGSVLFQKDNDQSYLTHSGESGRISGED